MKARSCTWKATNAGVSACKNEAKAAGSAATSEVTASSAQVRATPTQNEQSVVTHGLNILGTWRAVANLPSRSKSMRQMRSSSDTFGISIVCAASGTIPILRSSAWMRRLPSSDTRPIVCRTAARSVPIVVG